MAEHADALQLMLPNAADPLEAKAQDEIERTLDHQFLDAAMCGNIKKMQELLDRGVNINGVEGDHVPIVFAALFGGGEALAFLIDKGADVNKTSPLSSHYSAFDAIIQKACEEGLAKHKESIEYLLKHKADINHINSSDISAIQLASLAGNLELLAFLLDQDAAVPHTNAFGVSPLMPLLYSCQTEVQDPDGRHYFDLNLEQFQQIKSAIEIWIAHGFDINYQPMMQMFPVQEPPAGHGDAENQLAGAQHLLTHMVRPFSGYSPLMIACAMGHIPLVAFLISCEANVNQKGGFFEEETPLSIACMGNNFPLIQYLLETVQAEANPSSPLLAKMPTPLMYARLHENVELMRYLISMGAAAEPPLQVQTEINFLDLPEEHRNPGNTIFQSVMRLFEYAATGTIAAGLTIDRLCMEGADLNQRTTHGSNTPLHLACENNNTAVVRSIFKLLKERAEISQFYILTATNREGHTAFDIAAKNNVQLANIFRNHLQPMVDRYVFHIKSNPLFSLVPTEILQEMFAITYGNMSLFAKTPQGITLISEMFELAAHHHSVLMERRAVQNNENSAEKDVEPKLLLFSASPRGYRTPTAIHDTHQDPSFLNPNSRSIAPAATLGAGNVPVEVSASRDSILEEETEEANVLAKIATS